MSSSLLLPQELPSILRPLPTCTAPIQSFSLSLAGFQLVEVCKEGKREDANGRMREGLVSF